MTNSERLWKRAIYLLAQRDHSRGELQQKFQRARKKATPEEIKATLDKFVAIGMQDLISDNLEIQGR